MERYYAVQDGEWFEPAQKNHIMGCCDCGLVHKVDFRIYKGKVQMRAFRDKKRTSNRRRNKQFKGQILN